MKPDKYLSAICGYCGKPWNISVKQILPYGIYVCPRCNDDRKPEWTRKTEKALYEARRRKQHDNQ